jgi:SAM-dependent methyltransferase
MQPWANHFLKKEECGTEPKYPLRLVRCDECSLAQLDFTVPKETMFVDHTYLSGTTKSLGTHFKKVADDVVDRFFGPYPRNRSVLDIGSNDGTQLRNYKEKGWRVLGCEPCNSAAKMANDSGIPTLINFFRAGFSEACGTFDVINASGVLFHLEDLHSVMEEIRRALKPQGIFVAQFLYMPSIVENCAFDQIYHEHLLYYTMKTFCDLIERHGLHCFDAYFSPIHGGSIVAFCEHKSIDNLTSYRLDQLRGGEEEIGANMKETYEGFARSVFAKRLEQRKQLNGWRMLDKKVFGLGAPVKGNTLLNYCRVGPELIECLVERNSLRRGLCAPGSHIPVVMEDELTEDPDVYYVLAWNYKGEILERYEDKIEAGVEFYFPINPKGVAS